MSGVSDYVAEKRKLQADLEKAKAALREIATSYGMDGRGTAPVRMREKARAVLKELDK